MAKVTTEVIDVKPIEIASAKIRISGKTPLISHCWSEKARKEMLDAMMGIKDKSKKREPKNPVQEFITSLYWIQDEDGKTMMPEEFTLEAFQNAIDNGARFGFPADGIKQSAISAAYRKNWIPNKMAARGSFYVKADGAAQSGIEVCEVHFEEIKMREDNVKVGMGSADLRYRGEFIGWYIDLNIEYDANGEFSLNDLVNYINAAGFAVGIGEHRPERDGQNGMFRVTSVEG